MTTISSVTTPSVGAEAREQVVARLGALADLHQRAVAERTDATSSRRARSAQPDRVQLCAARAGSRQSTRSSRAC